jgi:hypothetical protein
MAVTTGALLQQLLTMASGLLGSVFGWCYAWSVNVGNSQVVTVRQCNEFNAFRGLDVGQVNDVADFSVVQVDFDELRQVFRQAGHFNFSNNVRNFAAFLDRSSFVDEVQWNVSGQFLTSNNADEVSVQHVAFGRVTLQGFDDDVLLGATDVQLDDVAVSRFVFEQFGNRKLQLEPGLRDDAGGGSHLSPGRNALQHSG